MANVAEAERYNCSEAQPNVSLNPDTTGEDLTPTPWQQTQEGAVTFGATALVAAAATGYLSVLLTDSWITQGFVAVAIVLALVAAHQMGRVAHDLLGGA